MSGLIQAITVPVPRRLAIRARFSRVRAAKEPSTSIAARSMMTPEGRSRADLLDEVLLEPGEVPVVERYRDARN